MEEERTEIGAGQECRFIGDELDERLLVELLRWVAQPAVGRDRRRGWLSFAAIGRHARGGVAIGSTAERHDAATLPAGAQLTL